MTDDTTHALPNTAPEPPEAPPVFGEWYPIERAPKDVLLLLFGAKDTDQVVGMHHSLFGWMIATPNELASMYPPTHFMPLPPKPSKKAAPKLPRVTPPNVQHRKGIYPLHPYPRQLRRPDVPPCAGRGSD